MKTGEARRGVGKLVPSMRDTGDQIFTVKCDCGAKVGWTKLSKKPAGHDLGGILEGLMAHQLGISIALWRSIAGCTRGRDDYLEVRRARHSCSSPAAR